MVPTMTDPTFSANEAACITGVPLKQVHRFIDVGVVDGAVQHGGGNRARTVAVKLAHETASVLTLDGRRRLVRLLLDRPDAEQVSTQYVSVDVTNMRCAVRNGLSLLAKARDAVSCDPDVLSGTPCFKGTRIPVHDVADMLANGDSAEALQEDFPRLTKSKIELATLYARAYPQRGRPRKPYWRDRKPHLVSEVPLESLTLPDSAR